MQFAFPKITDFGLAKRVSDSAGPTQTGTILGTPSYMAPEQAGGKSRETAPTTDVYALGAILYELLTGRPPFKAATPLDTVLQVVSQDPVPPSRLQPKLPRDLETICLKCLHKEQRRRYADALALAEDLRHFVAGEPILARPVGRVERAAKWARRRPALAGLIGVSTLAAVILVIVGVSYQARLRRTNDDLKREHDRAQAHLEMAMTAVDHMLTQITDDRLANVPEVIAIRRGLLKEARAYFERCLQREDQNPLVRQQTARACFRTASLHLLVGELPEALAFGTQAADLQSKLVADFPDEPSFRFDLSKTCSYLGHVYVIDQKFAPAAEAYDKAITLGEQVVRERPEVPEHWEILALSHTYVGFSNGYQNPALAEKHFRTAVQLGERLVHDHPGVADYETLLATAHGNLASVLVQVDRVAEAEESIHKGLVLIEPSGREPPREGRYFSWASGAVQITAGILDLRAKRWQEAEIHMTQGVAAYEQLVEFTRAFPWRMNLATSYARLAQLYDQTNRPALADDVNRKGVQLLTALAKEYPNATYLKPLLAERRVGAMIPPLRRGERVAELMAEAELVEQEPIMMPSTWYNLACASAVATATAEPAQREEYAQRALKLLSRAEQVGFFRGGQGVALLSNDADLNALRQRPEFQAFRSRVEAQAKQSPR